jgi:ribonuclease-3
VDFWKSFFKKHSTPSFKKGLKGVLGYSPGNILLYKAALTHRSIKETSAENNERLEYLGDAILSALLPITCSSVTRIKKKGFLPKCAARW